MVAIRFPFGALLAIIAALSVWCGLAAIHPIFTVFAASGLIPAVLAGLIGGFIAGLFAPSHKVAFSTFLGIALVGVLLVFMVLFHYEPAGRNLILWYWPLWLVPCFAVGGFLSRKLWAGP
jgi:hypothetical protein